MGSSYTNIVVKSAHVEQVAKVLTDSDFLPAYVSSPSESGWISVYPRITEGQSQTDLKTVTRYLSSKIESAAFGILVHDSDIFTYVMYENGQELDDYDSDPGYFDGGNQLPRGGAMQQVVRYCVPGTTVQDLSSVFLSKKPSLLVGAASFMWNLTRGNLDKAFSSTVIFRGDTLASVFAEKLGVPHERMSAGYKYIKQGEYGGADKLHYLPNEAEEQKEQRARQARPNW